MVNRSNKNRIYLENQGPNRPPILISIIKLVVYMNI